MVLCFDVRNYNTQAKRPLERTTSLDGSHFLPGGKALPPGERTFEHILARKYLIRKGTLIQYGILLCQSDNPKAEALLKQALQKESESEVKNPEDPEYNRNKGIIYKLFKMDAEAAAEFELSIEKDRNRLAKINRDSEKYWPAISMAKTGIAMENYDSAFESLEEAKSSLPAQLKN